MINFEYSSFFIISNKSPVADKKSPVMLGLFLFLFEKSLVKAGK